MDAMIANFQSKYPRSATYVANLNPAYPAELKMKMVVCVSLVMAKLDRGDYKKLQRNNEKLPNEVIDMFGETYLKNYSRLADKVYEAIGNYNTFPKMKLLDPDNFIENLINQYCN